MSFRPLVLLVAAATRLRFAPAAFSSLGLLVLSPPHGEILTPPNWSRFRPLQTTGLIKRSSETPPAQHLSAFAGGGNYLASTLKLSGRVKIP
jgi:hypothetical protein